MYFELLVRGGHEAEARQFLAEDFKQYPGDAIHFISGFLPISYSVSGTHPGDFDGNTYDRICCLVTPSLLHECVVKLYGDEVLIPVYDGPSDGDRLTTIAHQFEYVHRRALAKEAETALIAPGAAINSGESESGGNDEPK
jgi:hypothetical protein